jgi:hypothetical protein
VVFSLVTLPDDLHRSRLTMGGHQVGGGIAAWHTVSPHAGLYLGGSHIRLPMVW